MHASGPYLGFSWDSCILQDARHISWPIRDICCCLVAQLCLTLQPHGLQHTRLPCPSPSPGICSDSCPLSRWCHPTISSFVIPFSFCPRSFPASGSFPMGQLFTSGGQSIGASASVLPTCLLRNSIAVAQPQHVGLELLLLSSKPVINPLDTRGLPSPRVSLSLSIVLGQPPTFCCA